MLVAIALALSHVPTYSNDQCVEPPHSHDVSQVVYVRNSGGLEIHLNSDTDPFDTVNGEEIDVDVTFRDEIDPSTYELRIGCGGCHDGDVLNDAALITNIQYETPHIEPFTQTKYVSIFEKKEAKKFDTSALSAALCPERVFTIRLDRRANATDIRWGAVVGIKERFTFEELLSFPIYVLRNHGDAWNDAWWTMLVVCLALAPLSILLGKYAVSFCTGKQVKPLEGVTLGRKVAVHEIFYELAIFAYAASAWEMLLHLCAVQTGIPVSGGFFTGLFLVVLFSNGLGVAIILGFWTCSKSDLTGFVEMIVAFALLFVFGAGFYVGPAALFVAGFLRVSQACVRPDYAQMFI